jgi:hypothetical protein
MGARAVYLVEESLGHRVALIVEGVRLVQGTRAPVAVVYHIVVVRIIAALGEVDIGVREGSGSQRNVRQVT